MPKYIPVYQDCVEDYKRTSLIRNVRDRVYFEMVKNGEFEIYDDAYDMLDSTIRLEYAKVVGRFLGLSGFYLSLFVCVRIKKVWKYTNVDKFFDLMDRLEEYNVPLDGEGYYGIHGNDVVNIIKRYPNIREQNRIFGFLGEYFNYLDNSDIQKLYKRDYSKDLDTLLRVIKILIKTKELTPVPSSRYMKLFKKLDDKELMFTLTDTINWKYIGNYNNKKFQLVKIIKNSLDWSPISSYMKKRKVWFDNFGRTPIDRGIYRLPNEVIENIGKKKFSYIVKETKRLELIEEHDILALSKLVLWFGKDYSTYSGNEIHDSGINLSLEPSPEKSKFLRKYSHKKQESQLIVSCWDDILQNGINPLTKNGLDSALDYLQSKVYVRAKNIDLAKECAKWGVGEINYYKIEERFYGVNKYIAYLEIPKISISEGDFKIYILDKNDPRSLFLGHYTNCCQHIDGEGKSCCWYGLERTNGGFCVLEYRGEIKYQSFIWKKDNALIFDNIEGNAKSEIKAKAKELYEEFMLSFIGKFGIEEVYVGTGNSDITFNEKLILPNPYRVECYSDAGETWIIKR